MTDINASLLNRAWRKVDIKIAIGADLHVLRWRRGVFIDEVLFDDRRVATAKGLFSREQIFGLEVGHENGDCTKLLLIVDATPDWNDWSGDMKPRGVRLESADRALIAVGSCSPDRGEPFRELYDQSIKAVAKAIGLS